MAMAEAKWSELPTELVNLISQRIDNDLDLIRFRSVCSNWRNSSISNHQRHSLPFYNLQLQSPSCTLSKHIILLIKPPPQKQDQETLQPWLIRISKNSHGETQLFHPLLPRDSRNPYDFPYVLDFNKLSTVHLGNHFFYNTHRKYKQLRLMFGRRIMPYDSRQTVVAVTCHGKKPLALGILNDKGRPVVFHCRKEVWTEIPCMPTFFHDMCVFKKRFCAVNKIGRTFAFGPPPDYSEQLVAEYIDDGGGEMKFLVESEEGDELFLVDIYDRHCFGFPAAGEEDGLRLNVFRLDEKEKRWVKVTNLGDRVLFLGNRCSFSASIPKGGNCVIFIDKDFLSFDKMHCGMCVFQLDNGRLSPLSDYPHYIKLFWPPPDWIVKLCSTPKLGLDLDHQM